MEHNTHGLKWQDYWMVWGILLFAAVISALSLSRAHLGLESVAPFLPGTAVIPQYFSVISLGLFLRRGEPRNLRYTVFYQLMAVVMTLWQIYQRPASFQSDFGTLRLALGIVLPMAAAASLYYMAQSLSQEKSREAAVT